MNMKLNKRKQVNKISLILLILIIFLIFQGCKNDGNQPDVTDDTDPNEAKYAELLLDEEFIEYLSNRGLEIEKIEKIEIKASNQTEKARYGSMVSFYAVVNAVDTNGEKIELTFYDIKIEDNSGTVKLTDNTVTLVNDNIAEIKVSFFVEEKTFTYEIVKQDISYDNYLLLVNKFSKIDASFAPEDLSESEYISYTHDRGSTVNKMRDEALYALSEMFSAAEAEGFYFYALSGYRPYDMQQRLYESAGGENQNDTAAPGASEHQTGLTMDITWCAAGLSLTQDMQYHSEYEWLVNNSYKYGFVLRYPKGCDDITGYQFEPWHYRYIGKDAAYDYYNSGLATLDEFLSYYNLDEHN